VFKQQQVFKPDYQEFINQLIKSTTKFPTPKNKNFFDLESFFGL